MIKPCPLCFHFVVTVELQSDLSSSGITVVLPWSLPDDLQDDSSEPRAEVEKIFKDKVGESVDCVSDHKHKHSYTRKTTQCFFCIVFVSMIWNSKICL